MRMKTLMVEMPNLMATTAEPSLETIVYAYYERHMPKAKANELTELYFKALAKQLKMSY